ncbi:MAG: Rieske (2Fe-2S) protein [Steroidobacteraceae bacterium]
MSEPERCADGAAFDVERVVCRETELGLGGVRAFTIGGGDWPLKGFVVRAGAHLRAYVNRCPHAGHPLNLLPDRFFTPDGALILCSSHGALFEKLTGYCVAGPCAGRLLTPVPLTVRSGFVMIAEGVDIAALAEAAA